MDSGSNMQTLQRSLDELLRQITPIDDQAITAARERSSRLAKPPGSLGQLESLGAQLAGIARACPPPMPKKPTVIVAAADHGVHTQGVSDWPQTVTTAMIGVVIAGGAAINAIASTIGARVTLVDIGTKNPPARTGQPTRLDADVTFIDARIRDGSGDISYEHAMTPEQCLRAIVTGADITIRHIDAGTDLIALGDLGIGNTTVSACLIAALTGEEPANVTGDGANLNDRRRGRKIDVVTAALQRHGPDRDALRLLASTGGLEHAALVGAILGAASRRVPIILDGVTVNAAALVATSLSPPAVGYMIAGHRSTEPGATAALAELGLTPLIELQLRLGEGTGAALAIPMVATAATMLSGMALLSDVSRSVSSLNHP